LLAFGETMGVEQRTKAPLSIVAARIVQEALRPDVTLEALTKLAVGDPGFAARVLSMVNSAAYRFQGRVTDVRQGCTLLGERGLRNLALGLVVSDMVPIGDGAAVLIAVSMRRAVAARLIAEAWGERVGDDAFTAGMFLEIGLLSRAREDLEGAVRVARMPGAHRCVVDRAFGLEDHALSGASLARELGLPESVTESIARHHDAAPPRATIPRIAWAAERVAAAWEGGDLALLEIEAGRALDALGIAPIDADQLMRAIPEHVAAMGVVFDRPVGEQTQLDQLAADAHAQLVELNNGYAELVRRLEALLAEKEELTRELRRANGELANLAATDSLTGLPNKRALSDALAREAAMADRSKSSLSVVMIDVDHFKKVNDTWGHAAGDAVLVRVGEVLLGTLRASDLAARYGGEEFVAVLPSTDAGGAMVVAERMRRAFEAAVTETPQGAIRVTASFGVASVKGPGCYDGVAALLARADAALYTAKEGGRNRVALAPPPAIS
jgi:diguanylate cyclase (GGDEF)-like protein